MVRISPLFVAVSLMVACSAADPGVDGLTRAQHLASGGDSGLPLQDGGSHDGATSDASPAPDGSVAQDAFTGAGAYANNMPATSAATFHQNNSVGVTPGKDTACLNCHGSGAKTEFLFAGSVFKDKAGTMPDPGAEVRVRGSDGTGFLTNADSDGNFWFKKVANVMTPAMTGARDGANTGLMTGTISDTNCNNCHNGVGTDPMHLP